MSAPLLQAIPNPVAPTPNGSGLLVSGRSGVAAQKGAPPTIAISATTTPPEQICEIARLAEVDEDCCLARNFYCRYSRRD